MAQWSLSVSVASVVRNITGQVSVRAEENTAKIASFSIVPTQGESFTPDSYNGASVSVTYNSTTIFSGIVETAKGDESAGLIHITATDGIKKYFEGLSDAEILAVIPGSQLSSVVFGDRQSGWEQALHAVQTTLNEIHYSPTGALVLGDWATSGGFSYDDDDVLYLSENAEQAPNYTLINNVVITVEYGFTRLKYRPGLWSWTWPTDFCTWLGNKYTLPSRDMVQSAVDGSWTLYNGIRMETLPDAGSYPPCGSWTPEDQQQHVEVVSASWGAFMTWTQPIRERYELTVTCSGSVARYGTNTVEDGASHVTEFDTSSWASRQPRTAPVGWSTDSLGDDYYDEDDAATLSVMISVMLALARRQIWDAHRQNLVQFAVICEKTLDLANGCSISTPWMVANGKVYAYEHRLDVVDGTDITVITISCPRGGGGTGSSVTPPARPDTSPSHVPNVAGATIATILGNSQLSEEDNPEWINAYIGNYIVPDGTPTAEQVYEDRLVIEGQEIETESTDEVVATRVSVYAVGVPDHSLTETPNPTIP